MTAPTATEAPARTPVLATHADAVRAARAVADLAASGAAHRDRERRLPYAEVEALKKSGLLGITVPPAYGGPGLPPSTAAEVFRVLGETDPNLAQIPHSHFVYVNFLLLAGSESQRREVLRRVLDGALLANAQTERSGRTVAEISTTLSPDRSGGLVLEGTKYYCTGTLFADVIPVLARLDDPRGDTGLPEGQHVVLVPITETGIAVSDDWDAVGQRTTASGTVHLDHVLVRPEQVVPRGTALSAPHGYGAFAQLLHSAIDVGIARGALAEATAFVRDKSRPWWEAEVDAAVDDPLTVQRVGELVVEVTTAEAVLAHAAAAVDEVFAAPGEEPAADASLAVAALRVVAERSSLAVSSGLFEVSGTRAAGAGERLDRYWRNARTHTLHDPTRWKLQHLGRHALTGQAPPLPRTALRRQRKAPMPRPITAHWFLPTYGDSRQLVAGGHGTHMSGDRPGTLPYLRLLAQSAEHAGFESMLIPTGLWCEDAWVTAALLTEATERIKFLVALRPGLMSPTLAAQMAATLQWQSQGRLLLNVVTGGEQHEQAAYGDDLSKDERYARCGEFLDVVGRLWREAAPITASGDHVSVTGASLQRRPDVVPPLYFGGSSPAAGPVAAQHADVYLTWGEPVDAVAQKVEWIRTLARAHGRTPEFGIRLHVISRDTTEEAWAEAARLLEGIDPAEVTRVQDNLARSQSEGQRRMRELHAGRDRSDVRSLEVAPNLWSGVGLVRGGAGTALVGSHDEVVDRIEEYADLGITHFILSGYPHLEESLRVGESVLPRLADRGLWQPPADPGFATSSPAGVPFAAAVP